MKGFLIKVSLFTALFISVYFSFLYKLSTGYVDGYYYKFCGEGESLIIGLSRAHDGIVPEIINKSLMVSDFNGKKISNFAFEKSQSPFGEVYLESIKRKIGNSKGRGLFIISVTPGSFLALKGMTDKEIEKRDKKIMMLGKVSDVTSNPNFSYLTNCYGNPLYNIFFNDKNKISNRIVHPSGWNEFRMKSESYNVMKSDLKLWKSQTLEGYKAIYEKEAVSEYRIASLKKLIRFLKKKGEVVLVRMPTSEEVNEFENKKWEFFNVEIDSMAKKIDIKYLDYSDNFMFNTYDGSHLVSESAKSFTGLLADDIKKHLENE
ncbi:hypothetical protein [Costertonia aggregata]|uniref:Uncharacterized protein n=1 Tax=Costertonia aggregata TaxID=343403 RepID=A0A7H9ATA5_9FLAO|nr:hypothetical protein [Costertonia aggregata]QLG46711.1 hypothetical protein HYG79_15585 [Costertonia aggregata]